MNNKRIGYILLLSLLIGGCQKEERELEISSNEIKTWIYKEMKGNYLWLDEIPEYKTNLADSPEVFFNSLISENEKKVRNGQTYWYSYMEKKPALTKVSELPIDTYGMEYVFYTVTPGIYFARILYVLPGSPAEKAGVCRGMWIKKINNQTITGNNRNLLANGDGILLNVYQGEYTVNMEDANKQIEISSQISTYENPLLKDTILLGADGTKIGYLLYNKFTTGPNGFSDKTYKQQMNVLFANFKAEGVREFVLDLRYNPGGYLDCALSLGSYLVKEDGLGKVFCSVDYNPKSKLESKFYYYPKTFENNLNLERVYILTGQWTASASEAVINGLKPMMNVIQIGAKTEGKNLGSIAIEQDKYDWILHPIVAKIANANGEGDYWEGISPTADCLFDELTNKAPLGELGTMEDRLIQMAIKSMGLWDNSKTKTSFNLRESISSELKPETSSLDRKSFSSIRIN